MGKYMKKSKISAEVSLADISTSSSMALGGVRTRAKTLALRRLHMNSTLNPNSILFSSSSSSDSCYLELRSRRLRRPPQTPVKLPNHLPRPKQGRGETPIFRSSFDCGRDGISPASSRVSIHSGSASAASLDCEEVQSSCGGHTTGKSRSGTVCGASEASYGGENNSEPHEQAARRASSTVTSRLVAGDGIFPGSPTAHELEEFFASAEQEQCMLFMEKYNFDVLTDTPLRGRFQWVRLSQ
ncbi:hypothetical protein SAY86_020826 [Trapa natans]|uniref:Cyclin-dependent kinase inhibitor domain-containing protein n=1 Tax=Trapa natans TaxID=22666 RepID=A0AAN7M8Q3_TRANT|nr:hypothetical protein SAY86_020826 [Trapa natans]